MAGGKGTRLKPLTCGIPKPMVPLLNKPTMEYTVDLLKTYNIKDVAVTIAHLPNVITDYFGRGEKWGINLNYYQEDTPLGTGGSVKNAEDFIDGSFLVLSGDSLTDINIKRAVEFHKSKESQATLILKKESYPIEYGVVITDEDGRISRFLEKPSWGEVFSNTINTGIYILEPEVLDYFDRGVNFDFSRDLFPKLLDDGVPIYGYITDDYWCDIGALDSYIETHFDILKGSVDLKIGAYELEKGIWVGKTSKIDRDVTLIPPVYIGENCTIRGGCRLEAYTVIGDYCYIDNNVSLKRSILWPNVYIGQNSHCRGAVVCENVKIKKDVEVYENAVIGDDSILEDRVIVKPDIKIWPEKRIQENTVINENLVWGTKISKTIFGFRDISGEVNIDISPEFASKLGAAFASILTGGATVIISSDHLNASKIIKNALIAGIASAGVGVIDIGKSVMPVNRFAINHFKANGGIHIRMDKTNRNIVHIEFADKQGVNIQRSVERDIENLFNREEFKRCNADNIQARLNIENFQEFYINNGISLLQDVFSIRRSGPHIILASKSKLIEELACKFLERIGCKVEIEHNFPEYTQIEDYFPIMMDQLENKGGDFGVIVSEDGERLTLFTKKGETIQEEKYDIFAIMVLLKDGYRGDLILPYTAPYIIEDVVEGRGVNIKRVKSNPASVMLEMYMNDGVSQEGASQYILNYHGIWALGMLIDFLVRQDLRLEDLAGDIPNYYFIKDEITCAWQDKGRIIQQLAEEHSSDDIELFEGVRIKDSKGWSLILPDSEKPLFNIYTEGLSEEYAQELSIFYREKVKKLLKSQEG